MVRTVDTVDGRLIYTSEGDCICTLKNTRRWRTWVKEVFEAYHPHQVRLTIHKRRCVSHKDCRKYIPGESVFFEESDTEELVEEVTGRRHRN